MVPKFRGRNIETGEWVYGHLFYFNDGRHFISPTGTDVIGGYGGAPAKYRLENLVCFEINPKTLGQPTGLKDKNGVEIFEGDVVSLTEGECSYFGIVVRDYYEFYIKGIGSRDCFDFQDVSNTFDGTTSLEVTTNIYKNPELLEKANEN